MSYESQWLLFGDGMFQGRTNSVCTQQADHFKDDTRADIVALAASIARGEPEQVTAFIRLNAAGPGIAEKVETGPGTIDQSLVTDADLLALTQSNWPVIAGLYFADDGTPL